MHTKPKVLIGDIGVRRICSKRVFDSIAMNKKPVCTNRLFN